MQKNLLKVLLKNNVGSKEEVLSLIKNGLVKVSNKVCTDPGLILEDRVRITVDGVNLSYNEELVYFMLNKPEGYVTTSNDSLNRKSIYELIKGIDETVVPVGRLDFDQSGLLLLTNDKELKRLIEDPKTGIVKTYRIKIEGLLRKEESKEISRGVEFSEYKSRPCKIYNVEYSSDKLSTVLNISIKGEKNREIMRVFEYFNHKVKSFRRESIGSLTLDIDRGCYRRLKPHEIKLLKLAVEGIIKK